jgi:hypothetical protein
MAERRTSKSSIRLTTKGDTTKASGPAVDRMPTADAQGNVTYDRTIPAADLPDGTVENLTDLHVVQHGIDANNNGKYDLEGLGESTLAKLAATPAVLTRFVPPLSRSVRVRCGRTGKYEPKWRSFGRCGGPDH